MKIHEEIQSYIRFSEQDHAALAALRPHVRAEARAIADAFYARIEAFPEAKSVFTGPEQVERLKVTLTQWLDELVTGPWDDAYCERRERIGRRHVEVRLPHRYMFTAMNLVREHLCAIAHRALGDQADAACHAIGKVTTLDLALMTGTYMTAREHERVVSLQDVILAHLPLWVVLVDADGKVVSATGPRGGDRREVVGRPYEEALPAGLVEATDLRSRVARALEKRRVLSMPRVDLDGADGVRHLGLHVVPLEHPNAAFLVHVEDLTAAVQSEARHRAREALAHLGELSAGVAHELRNPLAGISGAIQVIGASFDPSDRRHAIMGKVQDQIGRLNRLVTDLLTFARPGRARLEPVRLETLARSVVELVRVESPGLAVRVEGEGHALADPDHVHRILLNLVRNAAQATSDAGEVLVAVADGHVRVLDDGPGVDPELGGRLFQPFVTTRSQGTGLGLAICRSSAELMGGQISLTQDPRLPGACFELSLLTEPKGG